MNSFMFPLLLAGQQAGADGAAPGPGGFVTSLIPFAAIIAIFYFLIIRPQNRKQKETHRMLSALKKGDKIVTIGGFRGVIQNVKESSVVVKVDENTKIEFNRSAISGIEAAAKEEKTEKIEDKKEEKNAGGPGNTDSTGDAQK
jgi:preprotein translocase subunit YajC